MKNTVISDLSAFIQASPTPYHAVAEAEKRLRSAGFRPWEPGDALAFGDKVYYSKKGLSLFAFNIGRAAKGHFALRLCGAHIDSPCIHIKPNPEMKSKGYLRLNSDVYGGAIINTWLDRPLSVAGAVAVKTGKGSELRLMDAKDPAVIIPNLAIHMNRDVNKGVELNKQTDILPLIGLTDEKKEGQFLAYIAGKLKVDVSDIIDMDLYIYNPEKPCISGLEGEFFSAPRLDDLTSAHALLEAITAAPGKNSLNIAAFFNNEEVGSLSANGADSNVLPMLLESIYETLPETSALTLHGDILDGTLLSLDVAHAYHPNMTSKYDPTCFALMGDGVVFKLNSNQRYINDLKVLADLELLCTEQGIPFKRFVNRSDVAGGGTIGNILASRLPMSGLDLGVPILAMHSARETMGTADQKALTDLLKAFFKK